MPATSGDTATLELVHWDATAQAATMLPGVARWHALPFSGLRRRRIISRSRALAASTSSSASSTVAASTP
ncbi:MAG: hypothetical protein U0168_30480 [Nannocystaceae bacterium]